MTASKMSSTALGERRSMERQRIWAVMRVSMTRHQSFSRLCQAKAEFDQGEGQIKEGRVSVEIFEKVDKFQSVVQFLSGFVGFVELQLALNFL